MSRSFRGALAISTPLLRAAHTRAKTCSCPAQGLRRRPLSDRGGAGARRRRGAVDCRGPGRRATDRPPGSGRGIWDGRACGSPRRTRIGHTSRLGRRESDRDQQSRSEEFFCRSRPQRTLARSRPRILSSLRRAEYFGPREVKRLHDAGASRRAGWGEFSSRLRSGPWQ